MQCIFICVCPYIFMCVQNAGIDATAAPAALVNFFDDERHFPPKQHVTIKSAFAFDVLQLKESILINRNKLEGGEGEESLKAVILVPGVTFTSGARSRD